VGRAVKVELAMLLPAPLSTARSQFGTLSGSGTRLAVGPMCLALEGRDPSAPTSFLYVPRLKIAIRYDFRHCGRGVPAANGTGVHSRNRAITNADHAPATFARSRLPWALEE
jgi:hypothetical protein